MAQGESPRNPLAFASVLYPGRCLASQAAAVKPLGAGALGSKLRPFAPASARASAPASAPASAAASAPVSAPAPAPASAPAAAPAADPRGRGFVADLPYQLHNKYGSGEI